MAIFFTLAQGVHRVHPAELGSVESASCLLAPIPDKPFFGDNLGSYTQLNGFASADTDSRLSTVSSHHM